MEQTPAWYVIVNPAAGGGLSGRRWPAMAQQLESVVSLQKVVFTKMRGHAMELAARAVAEGARHILAVGGDGTLHEVVNGLFQQDIIAQNQLTVALLPIGTGNDWVKTHQIPGDFKNWLSYFQNGAPAFHNIGFMRYRKAGSEKERYFINVAGLSYDGYVVEYVESHKKWVLHSSIYLLMIVWCLFWFKIPRAKIKFDKHEREGQFYTINVGIGRYSGGGLQLTPHAQFDGPGFGLTIAGSVSKFEVVKNIHHFFKGTLGQHPKVDEWQCSTISVEPKTSQTVLLEADGEFLGESPTHFELLPKAIQFWTPAAP